MTHVRQEYGDQHSANSAESIGDVEHEGHSGHAEHAGHTHGVRADADKRYLTIALLLIVGFMILEVIIGFLASSLALISDAGHMLTDAGAIGLALVAMRLAAQPASGRHTFGLKRVEIISAQVNGITLLVLAGLFIVEAIHRLIEPPQVEGGLVFIVAVIGAGVNLAATWALSRANRQSLNVEGSFQHILTDLYAFIATAIAGALIYLTGITRFDALAALVIAGLMLRAGISLVRESYHIFLEGVPRGLDPAAIDAALRAEPGVVQVHDLHVWEVTSGFPALSAHIHVDGRLRVGEQNALLERLTHLLEERFGITHTTLQLECADCLGCDADGLYCALDASEGAAHGHEHSHEHEQGASRVHRHTHEHRHEGDSAEDGNHGHAHVVHARTPGAGTRQDTSGKSH